jgi:predicted transcriptional regulator
MNRRRSNIEIIGDMLRVGENGAGKTEIMYSANMSYSQIQKYLGFLISHGFIDRVEVGNPVVTYRVTQRGLALLKSIDTVLEVLEFRDDVDF